MTRVSPPTPTPAPVGLVSICQGRREALIAVERDHTGGTCCQVLNCIRPFNSRARRKEREGKVAARLPLSPPFPAAYTGRGAGDEPPRYIPVSRIYQRRGPLGGRFWSPPPSPDSRRSRENPPDGRPPGPPGGPPEPRGGPPRGGPLRGAGAAPAGRGVAGVP